MVRLWTIISYAFMYAGFWHIASNMIILYFSGRFFLTFFSPKRLLNYYLLGAIAGGLFLLLSYNLFPVFADGYNYTLVGSSVSVMAVLFVLVTFYSNMMICLYFFIFKLWCV